MVELTSNQKSFIKMMTEAEEYEQRGFELLLKRPDFEQFFDALESAGLFAPNRNPKPVSADTPGYYRIPYWYALDYLKAVATRAGEKNDGELATKVLNVVRTITRAHAEDSDLRDNHHTCRALAEILGLVPTSTVSMDDIDLIPLWLGGRFDRSIVGHAFAGGTLQHFIASERAEDWLKACRILNHCTAIRWIEEKWLGEEKRKPQSVVDDFWLKELIAKHAMALGARVGEAAATVFLDRLREVYSDETAKEMSWLFRPAIEEHAQNHSWDGPENRFVEGLRDVLLGWIDQNPTAATITVAQLLNDEAQIVRRIAIHVLDERFEVLRDSLTLALNVTHFDRGHLHELYRLLVSHFEAFSEIEKIATLEAIRSLPAPAEGENPDRRLRSNQRQWISGIVGKGSPEADTWYQQLSSELSPSALSPHPDFNSYMESHWGPGPAPYTIEELLAFADAGHLVETLNAFIEPARWKGPTTRALTDALEQAVSIRPVAFLNLLPAFLQAKRSYQYGIISGFKKLWDSPKEEEEPAIDWSDAWPKLIQFWEHIIGDDKFWQEIVSEDEALTPDRKWIPPLISDFIRAGTTKDERAYAPDLLPRTWTLIKTLLAKSDREEKASVSDAMTRAINSPKGKAVEALVDHALRWCRVSDKTTGTHTSVWAVMKPVFDGEIAQCKNGNFEFSTLCGTYVANLHYLDLDWLNGNFKKIFVPEFPANCLSALDGLAYSPPSELVYQLLVEEGVLDWALRQALRGTHALESLIQRMALAYLWGREDFTSPRFRYLFDTRCVDELEIISGWFWSIGNQPLSSDQKEKIFRFWNECVLWSRKNEPLPTKLLSSLSLLSCYLETVGEVQLGWLQAVAPHVSVDHNADRFIEELNRLVDTNPTAIGGVLTNLLDTYKPAYDYEDRLKGLIRKLAGMSETRADALRNAERLAGQLPGMVQLFEQLTSSASVTT